MERARRSLALVLLLVAMVSVQAGASVAKQLFPLIGARGATALRVCLAAILLCAINRPWRTPLAWRQWRIVLLYGIVLGAMNLSFYLALARIPLGVAVAVEFTGPLAVALLASRRLRDIFWAVLAAGGLLSIVGSGIQTAGLDPAGVVLALVAGACWALYIVFGQRAGTIVPSGTAASLGMVVAACVVTPFGAVDASAALFTPAVIGLGLVVAVLSGALPYSLEMVALQRLPARTFGICMSLEPAIAAGLGLLILGERLAMLQWIGMACVVCASLGSVATSAAPSIPAGVVDAVNA